MQPQALIYFDISDEHSEPAFIQIGLLVVSAMAVSLVLSMWWFSGKTPLADFIRFTPLVHDTSTPKQMQVGDNQHIKHRHDEKL